MTDKQYRDALTNVWKMAFLLAYELVKNSRPVSIPF